uniref:Uncharacterized protein n=1 Tax=Phlebotomus papatasi TaxID=29031 RepID=A0A1B0D4Q5_PHLPP
MSASGGKNQNYFCKFVRGVVAFGGSVQFVENCTYLCSSTRPSEVPVIEPQRLPVGLCEQDKEDNRLWQWRQFRVFGSSSITGGSDCLFVVLFLAFWYFNYKVILSFTTHLTSALFWGESSSSTGNKITGNL